MDNAENQNKSGGTRKVASTADDLLPGGQATRPALDLKESQSDDSGKDVGGAANVYQAYLDGIEDFEE